MSSTNDTFHHLLVQIQPKSILKKPPSPRVSEVSPVVTPENHCEPTSSSDQNYDNKNKISQSMETIISIESPFIKSITTSDESLCQYEIDNRLIRTIPHTDSSSSPTSDDEQQKRLKTKSKKNYYRPCPTTIDTVTSTASSSDNDEERKAKESAGNSRVTIIRSDKHQQKDMQLDEFIRMYQQQGCIHLPTKEDHENESLIIIENRNNNGHHSYSSQSRSTHLSKDSTNDDTLSLLESIDTITSSSSSKSVSPLQLLFNVARTNQFDRRTKIDQIRQYVEEQIGISAFLTIYKLIKSSQIPIDIRQKPFYYYAPFIPHLCCLIMLESEQQKNRL